MSSVLEYANLKQCSICQYLQPVNYISLAYLNMAFNGQIYDTLQNYHETTFKKFRRKLPPLSGQKKCQQHVDTHFINMVV
jgi:hypothetical protein